MRLVKLTRSLKLHLLSHCSSPEVQRMMKSVLTIGKMSLGGAQRCTYPAVSALYAQSVRMFAVDTDKEEAPKDKKKPANTQKKRKAVNEQQGETDAIYHFLHTCEDARRYE